MDDPSREAAFVDYARQGGGLLAVHRRYTDTPPRALLGGVFDHHPVVPGDGYRARHPLTAGCAPFTGKDEHYHMTMDDPQVDVFMDTVSEHGMQPGGWTRTEGQGRVCVLTPGHNVEIWLEPGFQALLKNAIHWCAK